MNPIIMLPIGFVIGILFGDLLYMLWTGDSIVFGALLRRLK